MAEVEGKHRIYSFPSLSQLSFYYQAIMSASILGRRSRADEDEEALHSGARKRP